MKKLIFLTVIAAIVAFTGCKKNEEVIPNGEMPPLKTTGPINEQASSIRVFANFDALSAEVDKTMNFTLNELVTYEQSIGFNSYGKLADQAMMPMLQMVEDAEEKDEPLTRGSIEQMINVASQYVQIITDDEGEEHVETKYYRSIYRYVMNTNRMFKVDTIYFKVFEGGNISCGVSHYNDLLRMSEADFSILESDDTYDVFRYDDGERSNYGKYKEDYKTNGKERVYLALAYNHNKFFTYVSLNVHGYFDAHVWSKHKWCGIWWRSQRSKTLNLSTAKISVWGNLRGGPVYATSGGFNLFKCIHTVLETVPNTNLSNIFIHSAVGYASIPGATLNVNWL